MTPGFSLLGVLRPNRSCNPRNLLPCVTRLSGSSGPGARDVPMQPNPRNHRAEGAAPIRSCIERGAASDVFHVRGSVAMRVAAMLADMAACASGCRDPDPLPEDLGRGAGSEPIRDISRQSRVVNVQDGGLECRAVAAPPSRSAQWRSHRKIDLAGAGTIHGGHPASKSGTVACSRTAWQGERQPRCCLRRRIRRADP